MFGWCRFEFYIFICSAYLLLLSHIYLENYSSLIYCTEISAVACSNSERSTTTLHQTALHSRDQSEPEVDSRGHVEFHRIWRRRVAETVYRRAPGVGVCGRTDLDASFPGLPARLRRLLLRRGRSQPRLSAAVGRSRTVTYRISDVQHLQASVHHVERPSSLRRTENLRPLQ